MTVRPQNARRGTVAVEMAVVAPLLVTFIFGLIVVGLGVFRYNQTAHLAREAARWAAVRGSVYAEETGNAAATQTTIHSNVVLAQAAGMPADRLTTTVTWDTSNAPVRLNLDRTTKANYVVVTVSYLWKPEIPLLPEMTLTSTSRMPMCQ